MPSRNTVQSRLMAGPFTLRQEIGWKPQVSIEEVVRELLKDMTYWKDAPVWTPKSIGEATEDWFRYLGSVSQD